MILFVSITSFAQKGMSKNKKALLSLNDDVQRKVHEEVQKAIFKNNQLFQEMLKEKNLLKDQLNKVDSTINKKDNLIHSISQDLSGAKNRLKEAEIALRDQKVLLEKAVAANNGTKGDRTIIQRRLDISEELSEFTTCIIAEFAIS